MAYYDLNPFGPERLDLGFGIVASTIANVNRRKGHRAYKAREFMPRFDQREMDWEEQLSFVEMLTKEFGGLDLRAGGEGGNR